MWELIKYEPTNNNGDIYDAIRKLEREIRKTGGSAVAHHKLGSLYLKNNDLQDAIKHFEKSKEYDSTFLRAYLDLIFCLCMLKKYDKVQDVLDSSLERFTDDAEIFIYAGYFYNDTKNKKKALTMLAKAMGLEKDSGHKQRIKEQCNALKKEVYGDTDLSLEELLRADIVKELLPLLSPLSELISKGHSTEKDDFKVLLFGITISGSEEMAIDELSQWSTILIRVHDNPSQSALKKEILALQERGVPEASAFFATERATQQMQQQSKLQPIIVSNTNIYFDQLAPYKEILAILKVKGGPGRVVISSDQIRVDTQMFGPGTTTLNIFIGGGNDGQLYWDTMYLKSDIEEIGIGITAQWDAQNPN